MMRAKRSHMTRSLFAIGGFVLLAAATALAADPAPAPKTAAPAPKTAAPAPAAPAAAPAAGAPAAAAPAAGAAAPAAIDWKSMTKAQRKKYMKDVVMPKSKELFVAFDKKYEKMNC